MNDDLDGQVQTTSRLRRACATAQLLVSLTAVSVMTTCGQEADFAIDDVLCSAERVALGGIDAVHQLQHRRCAQGLGGQQSRAPPRQRHRLSRPAFCDLGQRALQRTSQRVGAHRLVRIQPIHHGHGLQFQANLATPPPVDDAFLDGRWWSMASSMRCFFFFSSTPVAAPTQRTATPPDSLARRLEPAVP